MYPIFKIFHDIQFSSVHEEREKISGGTARATNDPPETEKEKILNSENASSSPPSITSSLDA